MNFWRGLKMSQGINRKRKEKSDFRCSAFYLVTIPKGIRNKVNKMSDIKSLPKSGEQIDLFTFSAAPIVLNEMDSKGKKKPAITGLTEVLTAKGEPFKDEENRFFEVPTDVSDFSKKTFEESEGDSYEDRLLEALAAHRQTGFVLAEIVQEGLDRGYTEKYIIGIAKEGGYSPQSIRNCFCTQRTTRLRAAGGGRKTVAPTALIDQLTELAALLLDKHSATEVNAAMQYVGKKVKEEVIKAKNTEA